jgi:hypothetical protein
VCGEHASDSLANHNTTAEHTIAYETPDGCFRPWIGGNRFTRSVLSGLEPWSCELTKLLFTLQLISCAQYTKAIEKNALD